MQWITRPVARICHLWNTRQRKQSEVQLQIFSSQWDFLLPFLNIFWDCILFQALFWRGFSRTSTGLVGSGCRGGKKAFWLTLETLPTILVLVKECWIDGIYRCDLCFSIWQSWLWKVLWLMYGVWDSLSMNKNKTIIGDGFTTHGRPKFCVGDFLEKS